MCNMKCPRCTTDIHYIETIHDNSEEIKVKYDCYGCNSIITITTFKELEEYNDSQISN